VFAPPARAHTTILLPYLLFLIFGIVLK
jgi:hypothetical protein